MSVSTTTELLVNLSRAHSRRLARWAHRCVGTRPAVWLDLSPNGPDAIEPRSRLWPSQIRLINPAPWTAAVDERIREQFPRALFEFAQTEGLTTLYLWKKWLSLWWLMPISEMSPFRTALVHDLHRLLLIERVMSHERPTVVHVLADDPILVETLRRLVHQRGYRLGNVRVRHALSRWRRSRWFQGAPRRWYYVLRRLPYLAVLRWRLRRHRCRLATSDMTTRKPILLFTMFPGLWEAAPRGAATATPEGRMPASESFIGVRDRIFGAWVQELAQRGHDVIYAGISTLSWKQLLSPQARWRQDMQAVGITLLETLLSVPEQMRMYLATPWIREYTAWRRQRRGRRAELAGLDITPLLLRELDRDIWSNEIPFDLCVVEATTRFVSGLNGLVCAMNAFESQPIERAFLVGIRRAQPDIPVVGIQTSMCGRSHLGFHFVPEQIQPSRAIEPQSWRAPVPDYVATIGCVTYEVLRERLGPERVVLTGLVRICTREAEELSHSGTNREQSWRRQQLALPLEGSLVTVATSIREEETRALLDHALHAMQGRDDAFLLVKFHSLCAMPAVLHTLARQYSVTRYRLLHCNIVDLLLLSTAAIVGTSSVGVDAIMAGCMPIVYQQGHEYDFSPMQEVSRATFTFDRLEELQAALDACHARTAVFREKQAQWPEVITQMLYRCDGCAASRLYGFLQARGVMPTDHYPSTGLLSANRSLTQTSAEQCVS